ncbi:regulator of G-protein signaling 7-binding protein-like [Amphiura filiformis]|uniref:regulator of G-protein signaling 7-binding protein-like n=1 Tax=Amphiura filiformis TaxID=82378 RepID=UPI003B20E95D
MNRKSSGRCRPKSGQSVKQQQHQQQLQQQQQTQDPGSNYDLPSTDDDEAVIQGLVDDCERLVRDFNTRVAQYREKLIGIADVGDSLHFREVIRKYRRKSFEAAKNAKIKLFPHMKGSRTRPEFQKLFIQLTGCMEMLVQEMGKSLALLAAFPITYSGRGHHDVGNIPGMVEPSTRQSISHRHHHHHHHHHPHPHHHHIKADGHSSELSDQFEESVVLDSPVTASEDLKQIMRDMREINLMLHEVDQNELLPRQKATADDSSVIMTEIKRQNSLVKLRKRLICCCRPKHVT